MNRSLLTKFVSILLAVTAALSLVRPLRDADLWWHIVIGRWILAHRQVPTLDLWSFERRGEVWRAYSWLPEITFAALERSGLLFSLNVFVLLALGGTFLWMIWSLIRRPALAGLFAAVLTASTFSHYSLRPQSFTWLLYGILLTAVTKAGRGELRPQTTAAILFLLGSFWANSHLSAVIGLGTAFIFGLGTVSIGAAAGFAITFLAGTFLTPYLGAEWITFFQKSDHPLRFSQIREFQAPILMDYVSAFPLLLLVLYLGLLVERRRLPRIGALLSLVGTGIVCSFFLKFIPYLNILLGVLIAEHLGQVASETATGPGVVRKGLTDLLFRFESGLNRFSPALTAALSLLLVWQVFSISRMPSFDTKVLPEQQMSWIKTHVSAGSTVLTDFSSGGYVLYGLSTDSGEPLYRTSIDGRTNMLTPEQWDRHVGAQLGTVPASELIEYANPAAILWPASSKFAAEMDRDSRWCHPFAEKIAGYAFYLPAEHDLCRPGRQE